MGRKRNGKKRGGVEDDWEGSEASFASSSQTLDQNWDEGDAYVDGGADVLEAIAEALYEKRAATRERALDGLCVFLRNSYRYEELQPLQETLSSLLLRSVQKGKA